jgi:hypothetical protein
MIKNQFEYTVIGQKKLILDRALQIQKRCNEHEIDKQSVLYFEAFSEKNLCFLNQYNSTSVVFTKKILLLNN